MSPAFDQSHAEAPSKPWRERAIRFFLLVGAIPIVFMFLLVLVASVGFFFHISISAAVVPVAAIGTVLLVGAGALYGQKRSSILSVVIALGLSVAAIVAAYNVCGRIYDLSYDGQAYQQEAIIQLDHGWNPVYQRLSTDKLGRLSLWDNDYAKATWYSSAAFYKFSGHIEPSKLFALVLIYSSFWLVLAAALSLPFIGVLWSIVLAALVALNPISANAMLSFYVDGQVMSLFVSAAALAIMYILRRSMLIAVMLAITCTVLANLKFTGVVYSVMILGGVCATFFLQERFRDFHRALIMSGVSLFVSIAMMGFNPYITNTINNGNPFYPLYGKHAINLTPYNIPGNYFSLPSPLRLILANFAPIGVVRGQGTVAPFKAPWSPATQKELDIYASPGAMEGGFGPYFGAALIIAFLIGAVALIQVVRVGRRSRSPNHPELIAFHRLTRKYKLLMVLMGLIVASCVIDPMSSEARYVPQFFLVPILVIALTLILPWKATRFVAAGLAVLLAINVGFIARSYVQIAINQTQAMHSDLNKLASVSASHQVVANFHEYPSTRVKLQVADVHYTATTGQLPCKRPQRLLMSNVTQFCVAPAATSVTAEAPAHH